MQNVVSLDCYILYLPPPTPLRLQLLSVVILKNQQH